MPAAVVDEAAGNSKEGNDIDGNARKSSERAAQFIG